MYLKIRANISFSEGASSSTYSLYVSAFCSTPIQLDRLKVVEVTIFEILFHVA